jgi:Nicotinamide mononucleotide transporter
MTAWIRRNVNSAAFHVSAVALFLIVNAIGYVFAGGLTFVQDWGGGLAAVIATFFLVFKSQGYWAWMMVNAGLWTALFFHNDIPLLAWLQISFLIFSLYGLVQWYLVKYRVGFNPRVRTDIVGCIIALGVFTMAAYAYYPQDVTKWWALEAASVGLAITAMWMDAFRYRANWIAWTLSNCCSAPVFFHIPLWGAFYTIFLYQALNVYGWIVWTKDQRQPMIEEMEGAPNDDLYYSMVPDEVWAERHVVE